MLLLAVGLAAADGLDGLDGLEEHWRSRDLQVTREDGLVSTRVGVGEIRWQVEGRQVGELVVVDALVPLVIPPERRDAVAAYAREHSWEPSAVSLVVDPGVEHLRVRAVGTDPVAVSAAAEQGFVEHVPVVGRLLR